ESCPCANSDLGPLGGAEPGRTLLRAPEVLATEGLPLVLMTDPIGVHRGDLRTAECRQLLRGTQSRRLCISDEAKRRRRHSGIRQDRPADRSGRIVVLPTSSFLRFPASKPSHRHNPRRYCVVTFLKASHARSM